MAEFFIYIFMDVPFLHFSVSENLMLAKHTFNLSKKESCRAEGLSLPAADFYAVLADGQPSAL